MARTKGSRNTLPKGAVRAIEVAREAEELGIRCDEALGVIIQVMRGEITGRFVGDRLRAAIFQIEQEIGKAKQKIEHRVSHDTPQTFEIQFNDGRPFDPETPETEAVSGETSP